MAGVARFDVLPDVEGGWSVTRDRILIGWHRTRRGALAIAVDRLRAVVRAGTGAQLRVAASDGRRRLERRFCPG